MNKQGRYAVLLSCLSLLVFLLFVASLAVGPAGIGFRASMRGLFSNDAGAVALIMHEIRLPRALLGLMIGATLGLSGAVLQGYLRNPLAEPGLLGVSASASLGAVIAIYTGLSALFSLALPLLALVFAFLSVIAVRALAGGAARSLSMILAGVAVTSFAGAMTSLALNLSPNPFAAMEIMFWMLGSLTDRSMVQFWLAAPFMVVGWCLLFASARALNAMTLGEDAAASLGISRKRTERLVVWGVAVSVGAATAVSGAIGFIGLVVPHVLRPLVGHVPSRLLPASALGGAAVLLTADIAVRVIAPERDLKLGVLTAIVGAPFFLWLIYKTRREML
ncbi:FecCD family ABC transporter permease [Martelella mediterranea]|uniref:Iron complex transport system permease protein n=1 Tax=Martelella mediterranea TaxID=293089 RepID=A0A4R3NYR9_9HYPH|nr:iron ABC transporter permease [Martelella mediterranea]TCT40227.1 iron complex transport system permease protein [Martelella mediterranea]